MQYRLLVIAIILLFSSCAPRIFLPDRANVPMLREAGEMKLNTSLKRQNQSEAPGTGWSPSVDFAASPFRNLGLMASYRSTDKYANEDFWLSNRERHDSIRYTGSRFEFGAGYYSRFGGKGLFEIYGGGGFGEIRRNNLKNMSGNYHADYYRIFLQPAVGFTHRDIIEFSGGMRFTYQRYANFTSSMPGMVHSFTTPPAEIDRVAFYFIEPFVNFSVGTKYVKFNIQPGFSNNISSPSLDNQVSFYLSMGVTFQLAPRFWKG